MKRSRIWAIGFAIVLAGWLASGQFAPHLAGDQPAGEPSAAAERAGAEKPFRVTVRTFTGEPRQRVIKVPGRTEADRSVEVRARTAGIVEKSPFRQGDRVKTGDLLCALDLTMRNAELAQATAELASALRDFEAAEVLTRKKYATEQRLASERARVDAARAKVERIEYDISWTSVIAPIDGIVAERPAEQGSLLQQGQTCARIVVLDPVVVAGQVAERDIGALKVGQPALATLVTGTALEGRVRFIAPLADTSTRTFRVEIEAANRDGLIRDGITAELAFPLAAVTAHLLPAGIVGLNDDGEIGVKALGEGNTVRFMPVKLIAQTREGAWVSGLPRTVPLIVVGQDYVLDGQTVEPVSDEAKTAGAQS